MKIAHLKVHLYALILCSRSLLLFSLAPLEFSTHSGSRACRSSLPKVFCKKAVLKNFAKFTGIHLCQSLFFNKVANLGLRPATSLKKKLWHLRYRTRKPQLAASGHGNMLFLRKQTQSSQQ